MTKRDEFDDHEGFQSAFGKIAAAMEHSRTGLRQRGPLLSIMTAAVALFVLFAVFWSTYPRNDGEENTGPVPMIRADASAFKAAPDDPGGMDIPYRDSTVFETLRSANNAQGDSKVESLLPAPEQPMAREQVFAGFKTDPIDSPIDPTTDMALDAEAPVTQNPVTEDVAAVAPIVEPAPAAVVAETVTPAETKPVETAKAVTAPDAEKATKIEPAVGNAKDRSSEAGTHYIQLGSVKDRSGAEAEWNKLKKEFPAQLGSLSLRIQDVTIPDRGTFYRIQGGSVAQAKAKEICAAIAAKRSGGCIVVAR